MALRLSEDKRGVLPNVVSCAHASFSGSRHCFRRELQTIWGRRVRLRLRLRLRLRR
jgi:hypothetical protein